MSFKVIKGTFHVTGYSPDGDSVRFKAENEANWLQLKGGKVRLNSKGHAQLRIEAIDTLETHYKSEHQPDEFADAATKYLFRMLGIKNVVWNEKHSKVVSADDGCPGFIVSRMAERYGRPVSFVFRGNMDFQDGQEIFLNNTIARKSANYKLLLRGYAYPTFYDGMFYDLRELFAKAAKKARQKKLKLWASDNTNKYIGINEQTDISENLVLMPKYFRRVTAFLKQNNNVFDAKTFLTWMEKDPEKVLVVTNLHFTHFDNLFWIDFDNGKIRLLYPPEDIIFLS